MRLFTLCVVALLSLATVAQAQETCTEEGQTALETCIADATTACEATYPECQPAAVTLEDAQALLLERCGTCEEARNFGKFNSCLKQVRKVPCFTTSFTD